MEEKRKVNSKITLLHLDRQTERDINSNRFAPDRARGWWWIQRVCFWVLGRIGAYDYDVKMEVKSVAIDLDDIVGAVMRNQQDVMRLYHKKAEYLIIGAAEWQRLVEEMPYDMIQFEFPRDYNALVHPPEYAQVFRGLRVVVVPWIEGLFVLPER